MKDTVQFNGHSVSPVEQKKSIAGHRLEAYWSTLNPKTQKSQCNYRAMRGYWAGTQNCSILKVFFGELSYWFRFYVLLWLLQACPGSGMAERFEQYKKNGLRGCKLETCPFKMGCHVLNLDEQSERYLPSAHFTKV
jgi:hypothetical protein